MGRSVNLIDKASATFFRGKGSWSIQNGSVYLERNDVIHPDYSTLAVTPFEASEPVVFEYFNIPISRAYAFDSLQFHCRVKCIVGCAVDITLTNSNLDSVVRSERTGFNNWGICRSRKFVVPDIGQDIFINIKVEVRDHYGNPVKLTIPSIYISSNIFRDLFVLETFVNLPQVIKDAEINHEFDHDLPDFPLTRFIELPGNFAGDVVDDYYAFLYLTLPEGKSLNKPETLSQLVEPLVAKPRFLSWLSQFVGVYLDNPTTGKTPWQNIPTQWRPIEQEIDPANNPTYTTTSLSRSSNVVTAVIGTHEIVPDQWITLINSAAIGTVFNGTFQVTSVTSDSISWSQTGQDESATLNGSLTLLDTEWQELENYNPALDGLQDYLRWQVKYAYTGMNSGTYGAVVNTVKRVLSGDRMVTVFYAWEDDPWQVLVRTKTSETPDGVNGVESFIVKEYIKKVKPAGYKIIHECTETGV